ncbi:UvrB/UvrC motif-containing protein [Candidatus Parcubacteria bacterium]|nr:UvrB/UvrC motif-containing protein [Candidatus Parcubacteria bacterium]
MKSQELQKLDLPDCPGVYYFFGPKKEILYIGKATSLKDRVKSYFGSDLIHTRGPLLVKMIGEAVTIAHTTTDSVLEALMLEAHQIKKHKPYYNSKDRDDKSSNYVIITDEDFPRLIVIRGRGLEQKLEEKGYKSKAVYGPFPHGSELREALKIIRRIFPYRDEKCKVYPATAGRAGKPCFNAQIGLCPGPCAGWITKREYRKQVKRIQLFFEGKKVELIKDLEKEMKSLAKEQKFEEADKIKHTLYALEHIQDMALIKRDIERTHSADTVRIEAYDIAHMSGKQAVGVMVVVEDGELNKSQYRKFKIRVDKNDDVGNLKEVITRRLNHPEWDMPQVVVIDGGVGQLNAAKEVFKNQKIEVVAVVKDERHKAKHILGDEKIIKAWGKSILLANADAHRFAIGYHRKLRGKGFRI